MGTFAHNVHFLKVLVVFQIISEIKMVHELENEAKRVFKSGVNPSEQRKALVAVVEVAARQRFIIQSLRVTLNDENALQQHPQLTEYIGKQFNKEWCLYDFIATATPSLSAAHTSAKPPASMGCAPMIFRSPCPKNLHPSGRNGLRLQTASTSVSGGVEGSLKDERSSAGGSDCNWSGARASQQGMIPRSLWVPLEEEVLREQKNRGRDF